MIYIKQKLLHPDTNEYFVVMQLYTMCCKDILLFKRITDKTWYSVDKLEECNDNWNRLINQALENDIWMPK